MSEDNRKNNMPFLKSSMLDVLGLLKAVKSQDEGRAIPFIFCKSEGSHENLLEAIRSKDSGLMTQPLTAGLFVKKIEENVNS